MRQPHESVFMRLHYANETTARKCCPTARNDMPPGGWFNTCGTALLSPSAVARDRVYVKNFRLNASYSFRARILPFQKIITLSCPQKFMNQNFNLGPGFRALAQRAQNGLKLKNWTSSTVFELGVSSLGAENSWKRFFIWNLFYWAVVHNVPKMAQKEKLNSSKSFWDRILPFT